MSKSVAMRSTNNYRKMHHKPMRRKPLKRLSENLTVIGKATTGGGMYFSSLLHRLKMQKL